MDKGDRVRVVEDKCPPSLVGRTGVIIQKSTSASGDFLIRFTFPNGDEQYRTANAEVLEKVNVDK